MSGAQYQKSACQAEIQSFFKQEKTQYINICKKTLYHTFIQEKLYLFYAKSATFHITRSSSDEVSKSIISNLHKTNKILCSYDRVHNVMKCIGSKFLEKWIKKNTALRF